MITNSIERAGKSTGIAKQIKDHLLSQDIDVGCKCKKGLDS